MKTAICAIIKDEHLFLKEWIDWHLGLGFDAIHLFEDKGSQNHEEICAKYSNVSLRRYEDDEQVRKLLSAQGHSKRQLVLYRWFAETYRGRYNWAAFIDLDEFIMLEDGYTLDKLCNEFSDYPTVYLFWKMKGASGHLERPQCGVIEAYTETCPFLEQDVNGWNCKSLVNLRANKGLWSLHHGNGGVCTNLSTSINTPVYGKAWINHYFTKSWEDWLDRIYKKGGTMKGHRTLAQFFEANPSMEHLRDELIASVADKIPNGTYWLDRKRGLIAGGNVRKIMELNKKHNEDSNSR